MAGRTAQGTSQYESFPDADGASDYRYPREERGSRGKGKAREERHVSFSEEVTVVDFYVENFSSLRPVPRRPKPERKSRFIEHLDDDDVGFGSGDESWREERPSRTKKRKQRAERYTLPGDLPYIPEEPFFEMEMDKEVEEEPAVAGVA